MIEYEVLKNGTYISKLRRGNFVLDIIISDNLLSVTINIQINMMSPLEICIWDSIESKTRFVIRVFLTYIFRIIFNNNTQFLKISIYSAVNLIVNRFHFTSWIAPKIQSLLFLLYNGLLLILYPT